MDAMTHAAARSLSRSATNTHAQFRAPSAAPSLSALVIDDDWDTAKLIENVLQAAGFSTYICVRGEDAIEQSTRDRYDLITMDLKLNGMDGYETIRRIRSFSNAYIMMITSSVDEASIVQGYASGADDFIPKPFHPHEFRAHVNAYLRRVNDHNVYDADGGTFMQGTLMDETRRMGAYGFTGSEAGNESVNSDSLDEYDRSWITLGALSVNTLARQTLVGGEEVRLTKTEFNLLVILLQSGCRVRSKASLVLELHAGKVFVTNRVITAAERRSVEVHLANLRRKLNDSPSHPRFIVTVHGVGYRLAETPSVCAPQL